jgi:hypothetical protein
VEKIASADPSLRFSALAPAHQRFALQGIDDGFLLAVVVNTGASAGFDEKNFTPEAGLDAAMRNGRETLRAGRL